MRSIPAVLATMVVLVTSVAAAFAQSDPAGATVTVPRLIHVTGAFRPASGQPASVEVVTVSIYAEPDGGMPVWQERQTVAVDQAGRFTLLLGASDPDGIPAAVFGAAQAQWMGLLFERVGEVEQPRVRIASVPYALKASDAETLGGLPASAYLRAPTAEPTSDASRESSPAATAKDPPSPAVVLPGTTNFLAKYVNGADVGNSAVYETGGAVGMGTTTPSDWLHVRFTNTGGSATGLAVQNLGNTASSYSGTLFYDQNGALGQFQGFNNVTHEYRINNIASSGSINFMLGSSSKFLVASSGNIGMGTSSPAAPLEVSNAISGGTANVWVTSYTNAVGPYFLARRARGTFAAPAPVQGGDTLSGLYGRGYGSTGFSSSFPGISVLAAQNWTDAAQGTALRFITTPLGSTTPVPRMTLDASGNLGIGTAFPSASLDVVRDAGTGGATQYLTSYSGSSSSGESNLMLRVARGTAAAPAALQDGDELGGFGVTGYGSTTFGDFNAGMAMFAAQNWTDAAQGTVLVLGTTPLGSNEAQITMVILPDGKTGIGVPVGAGPPPLADRLEVFGDIRVGTTGTNGCLRNFAGTGLVGTCVSDRRYKKDITPFGAVLDQLTALQPVHYFWRASDFPQQRFGDSRAYGLIAQDVEAVLPELVATGDDGFKAVDYTKLPLLTIQAVKELKAENDALKRRVDELDRLVTEMLTKATQR